MISAGGPDDVCPVAAVEVALVPSGDAGPADGRSSPSSEVCSRPPTPCSPSRANGPSWPASARRECTRSRPTYGGGPACGARPACGVHRRRLPHGRTQPVPHGGRRRRGRARGVRRHVRRVPAAGLPPPHQDVLARVLVSRRAGVVS
jgi:hypothetical protein